MDDLKQAVQTASYEQKDPLLIYKFESFNLFKVLIDKVNKDIVSFLIKAGLPIQSSVQEDKHKVENHQTSRPENTGNTPQKPTKPKAQPVSVKKDTNRNEKVMITNGSQTKELKWKKAKPLVESGEWRRL